jgi:ComF family protein
MWQSVLDLVFPRFSLSAEEGEFVTKRELREMMTYPVRLESEELRKSGVQCLESLVAAVSYGSSPLLRRAVHLFKYQRVQSLSMPLSGLLASAAIYLPDDPDSVLCPVPLHWSREYVRGFNQSKLLAEGVAVECGWICMDLLRRKRPTGHQAHRSHDMRHAAMDQIFEVASLVLPSHVVLIDDIATTCSTLDACAKELKEHGVVRVDALVLAKG